MNAPRADPRLLEGTPCAGTVAPTAALLAAWCLCSLRGQRGRGGQVAGYCVGLGPYSGRCGALAREGRPPLPTRLLNGQRERGVPCSLLGWRLPSRSKETSYGASRLPGVTGALVPRACAPGLGQDGLAPSFACLHASSRPPLPPWRTHWRIVPPPPG